MPEDFFKIIVIVLIVTFLLYLVMKFFNKREGFTTSDVPSVSSASVDGNIAGGAANYADNLKIESVKVMDSLNIPKYRTDYENAVIQMDDYISALMVKEMFKLNANSMSEQDVMSIITTLNTLNAGKQSLNTVMKTIDTAK